MHATRREAQWTLALAAPADPPGIPRPNPPGSRVHGPGKPFSNPILSQLQQQLQVVSAATPISFSRVSTVVASPARFWQGFSSISKKSPPRARARAPHPHQTEPNRTEPNRTEPNQTDRTRVPFAASTSPPKASGLSKGKRPVVCPKNRINKP